MNTKRVAVSLAVLISATTSAAMAGPQSMLDPYSNIKAPTTKELYERKAAAAAKAKGDKPYATAPLKNPAADLNVVPKQAADAGSGGFIAGTKQVFHGIGTATKGAATDLVHPVKSMGTGIASGGKKVGDTAVNGARASTQTLAKGVHKVGDGVKAAGGKVKDSTEAAGRAAIVVPKKLGSGLKAAGDKVKEGGGKIAQGTKAVGLKMKESTGAVGEKLVAVPKAIGSKVKDSTGTVGEKLVAVPKALGHGIASAVGKTGETTKRVAAAPLHFASKLNPFHHKEESVETATTPSVSK